MLLNGEQGNLFEKLFVFAHHQKKDKMQMPFWTGHYMDKWMKYKTTASGMPM